MPQGRAQVVGDRVGERFEFAVGILEALGAFDHPPLQLGVRLPDRALGRQSLLEYLPRQGERRDERETGHRRRPKDRPAGSALVLTRLVVSLFGKNALIVVERLL